MSAPMNVAGESMEPFETMSAKIYRPAKTAMQSGKAKTNLWVLEFDQEKPRTIDPIMGYTSSGDMKQQLRLTFENAEQAIAYAERNGIEYRVIAPKEATRKAMSLVEDLFWFMCSGPTHRFPPSISDRLRTI